MDSSRRLAMFLLCGIFLTSGCSRSNEAELAQARAEAVVARAEAAKARAEAEAARAAPPKPDTAPKHERKSDDLAKDYIYPGATLQGQHAGGGATPAYLATFVTTDDREKVTDWYAEKIAKLAQPRFDGITWAGDGGIVVKHDTHQPPEAEGADPKPRPVGVSVFAKRWDKYTVTAVVSRTEGERHTHIVLTLIQDASKYAAEPGAAPDPARM